MRKILLFTLALLLFSSQFTHKAHADIIQDVYTELLGGHSDRFPHAALDERGSLPATADFCPVCPVAAGTRYTSFNQSNNIPGCYNQQNNRVDAVTALDCGSTSAYKFCANNGQATDIPSVDMKGCCKNANLTECTKNPSNPNEPPAPETDPCPICPDGTFYDSRGQTGDPACYYPRSDPNHPPNQTEPGPSNGSVCAAGKICDTTYYTGCKTEQELGDLENNPPGGPMGEPNLLLNSPCAPHNTKGCLSIKTAFGEVSTDAAGFTRWILGFVLSISGGIVILIIVVSGIKLMTSQGDPEKVKNARDQLTAAIVGLLFIIFSLVILELITRNVLGLPGFGG